MEEINALDFYREPPFIINSFTFTDIGSSESYSFDLNLLVDREFDINNLRLKFRVEYSDGLSRLIKFINSRSLVISMCLTNSFGSKVIISCIKSHVNDCVYSLNIEDKINATITIPIDKFRCDTISEFGDSIEYISKVSI